MRPSKQILVVDNDLDVLRAVKFNLEMAGYEVLTAENLENAQTVIREKIFYLAIIDIRLEHEESIDDKSGFDIAKSLPKDIPFLVFTAYEDKENIRQAYHHDIGAREIINKQDADAAVRLVEEVDSLFSKIEVNFNLQIVGTADLHRVAEAIKIPEGRNPKPTEEDVRFVFQKLFHDASSIHISFLLSLDSPAPTQAGSVLLQVRPQYEAGWGALLVVKLSHAEEIHAEANNYERIKPFLGGHRIAILETSTYSRQIGALAYRLIGAQTREDAISPLSKIFFSLETIELQEIFLRFFKDSFATLFADASRKHIKLTESYTAALHLTPQKLFESVGKFHPQVLTEPVLRFPNIDRNFLNPILWSTPNHKFRDFSRVTRVSLCHGDLHSQNILVDSEKHFWLVDFARVEENHVLRDFAELETDIKFNLLRNETNLATLYEFECALLLPNKFHDVPSCNLAGSKNLIHAYSIIISLRKIASELINLEGSMDEYYIALLFHTLNVLRLKHITFEKKEHALISAALICERLEDWPKWNHFPLVNTEAVSSDLHISENASVLSESSSARWPYVLGFAVVLVVITVAVGILMALLAGNFVQVVGTILIGAIITFVLLGLMDGKSGVKLLIEAAKSLLAQGKA